MEVETKAGLVIAAGIFLLLVVLPLIMNSLKSYKEKWKCVKWENVHRVCEIDYTWNVVLPHCHKVYGFTNKTMKKFDRNHLSYDVKYFGRRCVRAYKIRVRVR